jgi:hypothetical protein
VRVRRLALCLSAAAIAGGCGSAHHTGQSVPKGFRPVSLSAIDDNDLFLLGTLPCSAARCYAIERSGDGGRTFTRIAAPSGLPTEGSAPTLRFVDARVGVIWVPFGWGGFYRTHDGGVTWRHVRSPDLVAFTTTGAKAYAIVAHCTTQRCTGFRFARGPASASRWRESPLPFVPDGPVLDLAARGNDVWLLGTPRTARYQRYDRLARSTDGGRTFTTGDGPCVPGLGGGLMPSSTRVVWAVCPTGLLAGAARSSDGGVAFSPLRTPPLTNGARLAPASSSTAVLAANGAGAPLYRTTDGGATWRPIAPRGKDTIWYEVVFTSAHVGDALVQLGGHAPVFRRTTDGGETWLSPPG